MRRFFAWTILIPLSVSAGASPALPQEAATPATQDSATALSTSAERLDSLFAELKRETNADAAEDISNRIRLEWQDSGSATINLLIQWADKSVAEDKNGAALDYLDEVVRLAPDYPEGWNRRATLHYKMGNLRKSMSDINQVLILEPRHFGAIAGLAAILTSSGEDELALRAWERFLDVYPSERRAQKEMGDLAEKLAGRRT
ncbi:hypothetical protein LXM94_00535 [Rhizobium sp. TRM95111]|uniref:hypothetical protein n=1 Tax=Rhizobium alarense TaxID=2846851 RepID=UPI001F2FF30A|nr:hypothetical protein [Rhizobium alarense]MCF3638453.1 hypothetical protein [Rhizobium alarense]